MRQRARHGDWLRVPIDVTAPFPTYQNWQEQTAPMILVNVGTAETGEQLIWVDINHLNFEPIRDRPNPILVTIPAANFGDTRESPEYYFIVAHPDCDPEARSEAVVLQGETMGPVDDPAHRPDRES